MATIVMESIGRVFISLQQIWQVPQLLTDAAPSMPSTVRDTEVPSYFRERYVCTGYRPLNQNWRYYFLSLFQRHNETLNIWTHLVAFLVLLIKLCQLTETVDFISDRHSWPLLILVLSSLTYSAFSVVAHLLGGKSDLAHYCFYFLDYVGVAQYQYGSAVVHFYYAVDESVHGLVSGIFMPTATILSCLSCLGCCYGRYCNHSLPTWICQVVLSALPFVWDISPRIKLLFPWMFLEQRHQNVHVYILLPHESLDCLEFIKTNGLLDFYIWMVVLPPQMSVPGKDRCECGILELLRYNL
uniref:Progestin and adipoQ receptor family member VII, a n=1 Tax=Oreochromis niloticus TaxID=8128 RepID=A0A669D7K9_ORENI